MILGLKSVDFELRFFLNDDESGPVDLVGSKQVPILRRQDGQCMAESMDIVRFVDEAYGDERLVSEEEEDEKLAKWISEVKPSVYRLAMPRWISKQAGLPEFATENAVKYFVDKKSKAIGDFAENLENSEALKLEAERKLMELEQLGFSEFQLGNPGWIHRGLLSVDDFHLFAILRSLTIVKDLKIPPKVKEYIYFVAEAAKVPLYFHVQM